MGISIFGFLFNAVNERWWLIDGLRFVGLLDIFIKMAAFVGLHAVGQ